MPDIINRKLRLQPVNALEVGYNHNYRIVDQSVEGLGVVVNVLACFADLSLRAKIELE